jgi:hypothetical protein
MFKLINMKEETNRGFFTNSALDQRPAFNTITPDNLDSADRMFSQGHDSEALN